MYIRLISYHVKPWMTEDQVSSIYDEMVSLMQPLAGFLGMSLLTNNVILFRSLGAIEPWWNS